MKVLFVCRHFPPEVSGMATQMYEISRHLRDKVDIFTVRARYMGLGVSEAGDRKANQEINFPISTKDALLFSRKFKRIISETAKKINANIIQTDSTWPVGYALVFPRKIKSKLISNVGGHVFFEIKKNTFESKKPFKTPIHWLIHYLRYRFMRYIGKKVLSNSDIIVVDGHDIKIGLIQNGIDGNKIEVITNGIDVELFKKFKISKKKLKLPSKKIVLFVGRLSEENGPHIFVDIVKDMNCVGVLIGEGTMRADLEKKIKEEKIKNIILLGAKPHTDLPKYINASDICFYPLQKIGGVSQVVPESMACEKPVITTKTGDLHYVVDHGKEGYLIDPQNFGVMRDTLNKLLKSSTLQKKIGKNARKKIETQWSWDIIIEKYVALYNSLTN